MNWSEFFAQVIVSAGVAFAVACGVAAMAIIGAAILQVDRVVLWAVRGFGLALIVAFVVTMLKYRHCNG